MTNKPNSSNGDGGSGSRDDQKSHSDREEVTRYGKRNPEIRHLFMLKMAFHIFVIKREKSVAIICIINTSKGTKHKTHLTAESKQKLRCCIEPNVISSIK